MDRNRNLQRVADRAEPWDIVVIGGGATGAGCALDAASRGYSVLLLEQHDFGKGTSSRSTKLIHGGVRYLRQGNVSLVREALRERSVLLKNAPHVVHKQEFIIPCYSTGEKLFYSAGMKMYDVLAGTHGIGRSRTLNRRAVLERLHHVKPKDLKAGILFYDGQFDDTRLLIDILRTADSKGAVCLNYAKVLDFLEDDWGSIIGVKFQDVETGNTHKVRSKSNVNATGAFCDSIRKMSMRNAAPAVTYSQGVHLVFDRKLLPRDAALLIPKTSDGRVLFCIPWKDHVLVGTTDTPVEAPQIEPHALDSEIDFILDTAAEYLDGKPTRGDILSVFAGIRPLVKTDSSAATSSLSRGHHLFVDKLGLVTITGGKWTTYRQMAKDAIDKAVEIRALKKTKSITAKLPIEPPIDIEAGERLHPALDITSSEVVRAVLDEMARTVEDLLARRTRALFLNAKAAIELAPKVGEIMAKELGKDDAWVVAEVERFKKTAKNYVVEPIDM